MNKVIVGYDVFCRTIIPYKQNEHYFHSGKLTTLDQRLVQQGFKALKWWRWIRHYRSLEAAIKFLLKLEEINKNVPLEIKVTPVEEKVITVDKKIVQELFGE